MGVQGGYMKILLAGPGTGKTTKVKTIIDGQYAGVKDILVLSFTNATVNDLIKSFSNYENDTIILGDDDQSIYGFKDADPLGIIDLYGDAAVEKIDHENNCYRCPDMVVDLARSLIAKNVNRIDKPWNKTNKNGHAEFVQIISQAETDAVILEKIQKIKVEDPEASILILSPVRYYVKELIEVLNANGLGVIDFWADKISLDDIRKIWWLRAINTEKKILNMTFIANTLFTPY